MARGSNDLLIKKISFVMQTFFFLIGKLSVVMEAPLYYGLLEATQGDGAESLSEECLLVNMVDHVPCESVNKY